MDSQSRRVYNEIINEVCKKITESTDEQNIDENTLKLIRDEWVTNLENLHNKNKYPNEINTADGQRWVKEEATDGDASIESDDEMEMIEQNIDCYIMCLFLKVSKSKDKWKCVFKQGFINLGSEDIPFNNATGELEW